MLLLVMLVMGVIYTSQHFKEILEILDMSKVPQYMVQTLRPPTEPLTEVTNTKLLTAQGLQFSDVSANNHSMSKTGDVSTMPFTPYDYAEYDSTKHGGSIYFR